MELISLELGKEKELFSTSLVNEDSSVGIESHAIESYTSESLCSKTRNGFENSWSAEKETNHAYTKPVQNKEKSGENSSIFSNQYSSITYPKDGNISFPSSDLNEHVSNVQVEKFIDKIGIQSTSLSNELECETASNFENGEKLVPTGNEHVLDNSVKDCQLNINCQSDISSGSLNGNNTVESLISKSLEETPCSGNICFDLKPCMVVLKKCDKQVNDSLFPEKSFNCNTYFEQLDTISVISDIEEEAGNHSGLKQRELKSRKSRVRCSQSKKRKNSFSGKYVKTTIKGSSKIRKSNSKIFYDSSDSDVDSDKLNGNKCASMWQKSIQVSAQVHKPPETDDDSDVFPSFTQNETSLIMSKMSPQKRDCKNNEDDIQMNCDDSNLNDQNLLGKRKRNPSSISSMTFSDSECVSSKKRIIMPSPSLFSLQLPTNIKHETLDSDVDDSDNNHLPYSCEINEKLLTPSRNRGIHSTQNEKSDWTNQPDVDISHLVFKPCQVVLSRCDDLIEMTSSNADVNSKNLPAMRSSPNFKGFLTAKNKKRCNSDVSHSDSVSHLSELSDTDEILYSPKKTSPKQKLKTVESKKNVSGSTGTKKLSKNKKEKNQNGIINEIIALKNTMKRVERKLDKLLKVHLQVSDSY